MRPLTHREQELVLFWATLALVVGIAVGVLTGYYLLADGT